MKKKGSYLSFYLRLLSIVLIGKYKYMVPLFPAIDLGPGTVMNPLRQIQQMENKIKTKQNWVLQKQECSWYKLSDCPGNVRAVRGVGFCLQFLWVSKGVWDINRRRISWSSSG